MITEVKLLGLDRVVFHLNEEIAKIKGRSLKGIIEALNFLREDMDETSPLIPVKFGNLRASWFIEPVQENPPLVICGFSANYAVYVHEMVGANFSRPGAGAKWFQAGFYRNRKKMLDIIAENAEIEA